MQRIDGRAPQQVRPAVIQIDFVRPAVGSCLIACGGTKVICTASVEEGVPPFLQNAQGGWLTAEYAMLPASTGRRKARDGVKRDSRGVEISRLIGRSLRQAVDLSRLGRRTLTVDCDVLEADGGTRTAAITGGFVAICLAIGQLIRQGTLKESPVCRQVAAISCGLVDDAAYVDLCYQEDSRAQTDLNVVMDAGGNLIEIQGTAEGRAFSRAELDTLLHLAHGGISQWMAAQRQAMGEYAQLIGQKQTLVLASNNEHKITELKAMLGSRYRVVGMRQAGLEMEVEETGATFADNARLKAEAVRDATGYMALADDSGLSVDALDGQPGVHSARWAGAHGDDAANNRLLMEKMAGKTQRGARFVSALALASPFAPTRLFEGVCPGVITTAPRGQGGFGYDPYFEYENGQTFAQMDAQTKNQVSHRARAMQQLLLALDGQAAQGK